MTLFEGLGQHYDWKSSIFIIYILLMTFKGKNNLEMALWRQMVEHEHDAKRKFE